MALTAAAGWLNTVFAGYDEFILFALHSIANGVLTFLFSFITFIGEKGIIFFALALIFMCFSKTRKLGVCLFGAVACGALITNVILKDMIQRPRPFEANETFRSWWWAVNAPAEDGFSFPSGHVTAVAAGLVAIRLVKGKKWTLPAIGGILLMMIARNYLMAHYPSDVLAAAVIGTVSAFIAWAITKLIFRILEKNRNQKFCSFCLNFNLPDLAGIPSKLGLIGEKKKEEPTLGSSRKEQADSDNLRANTVQSGDGSKRKVSVHAERGIPKEETEKVPENASGKREKTTPAEKNEKPAKGRKRTSAGEQPSAGDLKEELHRRAKEMSNGSQPASELTEVQSEHDRKTSRAKTTSGYIGKHEKK